MGTNDLESGGHFYGVERYIQHEKYAHPPSEFSNDIAVIRVQGSIEFNDKVQPIELSPEQVAAGTVARLTGWGRLFVSSNVHVLYEYFQTIEFNRQMAQSQDTCKSST